MFLRFSSFFPQLVSWALLPDDKLDDRTVTFLHNVDPNLLAP